MRPEDSPEFLLLCKKVVEKYGRELDALAENSDELIRVGVKRIKELAAKAELIFARGLKT